MSLFRRARPSPLLKPTRAKPRTHAFHGSGQTAWNGEELCETCQQPKGHLRHDVQVDEQAAAIDNRKLGEGSGGDQ